MNFISRVYSDWSHYWHLWHPVNPNLKPSHPRKIICWPVLMQTATAEVPQVCIHWFDALYYWMPQHQLTINTMHPACDTAVHLGLSPGLREQGWQEWERNGNCVSALLLPASRGCEHQFLQIQISEEITAVWNGPRELPTREVVRHLSSKQHWKPWLWLQKGR